MPAFGRFGFRVGPPGRRKQAFDLCQAAYDNALPEFPEEDETEEYIRRAKGGRLSTEY